MRLVLAVLLGLPLLGLAGVVVAELIPDRAVIRPLYDAVVDGDLRAVDYEEGLTGNLVDRFSECKRMTIGLGDEPGENPIETALASPSLGPCTSAVPKIVGWAEGDGLERAYLYTRYWNGSAAVLRPAIALFGLVGTRIVATIALIAAAVVLWRQVQRSGGRFLPFAVFGPVVMTTDVIDLPAALLHSVAWLALMLTTAAAIALGRQGRDDVALVGMFVGGAVFLYFGDMANPDAAWAAATAGVGLGALDVGRAAVLRRVPLGAAAWIAGFAWMWTAKWLLGAVVVGFDVMYDNVTTQIEGRLSGDGDGVSDARWAGLDRNWDVWWSQPLTAAAIVACLVAVLVAFVRRRRAGGSHDIAVRLALAAPALIPIVWLSLLRNHSQIHAAFVFRSLAIALAVVTVAGVVRVDHGEQSHGVDDRPDQSGDTQLLTRSISARSSA